MLYICPFGCPGKKYINICEYEKFACFMSVHFINHLCILQMLHMMFHGLLYFTWSQIARISTDQVMPVPCVLLLVACQAGPPPRLQSLKWKLGSGRITWQRCLADPGDLWLPG